MVTSLRKSAAPGGAPDLFQRSFCSGITDAGMSGVRPTATMRQAVRLSGYFDVDMLLGVQLNCGRDHVLSRKSARMAAAQQRPLPFWKFPVTSTRHCTPSMSSAMT